MNTATYTGLPDPDYQSEFYADVPAKRALAWVFDTLIVVGLVLLFILLTVGIGFSSRASCGSSSGSSTVW